VRRARRGGARAWLPEVIKAGATHLVLAPVLAGRPVRWLTDEVIEPVLAQLPAEAAPVSRRAG
jgi:hypothetical protein